MNKYDFFRGKFLILISFLITFTLFYLSSYIKGLEVLEINSNDYLTKESKQYEIFIENQDQLGEIKEVIKDMNTVNISNGNGLELYYFNENSIYGPNYSLFDNVEIIEGYNILLGSDLYESYLKTNQKSYELKLKETNIYCNVVGLLESVKFDFKDFSRYILIDLNSNNIGNFNGIYKVDGNIGDFENILEKNSIEHKEMEYKPLVLSGSKFLSVQSIFIFIIIILFIFAMILIVKVWFTLYIKEAGVRIAFGGTKIRLLGYILRKYLLAIAIGILMGLALFFIYYLIFLKELDIRSLILPLGISILIVFGISLIMAIINYLIFSKKSIRENIEE